MLNKIITHHSLNVKNISDCKTTPLHKPKSRLAASHHLHRLRKFRRHFAPHAFWGGGYGGGALQCTRARGAPHGDGREGVFGSLPFMARSSVRLVSGDSLARVCPSGQTSCRLMRTECCFAIRASRATPSPPIPELRLVQGRRSAAQ